MSYESYAPWSPWQVANLIRYQEDGSMHPFTCPNEHDDKLSLIPTRGGWVCPGCTYIQDWAHGFMTGDHVGFRARKGTPDPFLDDVWFCTQCRDSVSWDDLDLTWFEAGTQKCSMCAKGNPYSVT